jgi:hypothetical protein
MSGKSFSARLARIAALEAQRNEREAGSLADRLARARIKASTQTREDSVRHAEWYIREHANSTNPLVARLVRAHQRGLEHLNQTHSLKEA